MNNNDMSKNKSLEKTNLNSIDFHSIEKFQTGISKIKKGNKECFIDINGEIVRNIDDAKLESNKIIPKDLTGDLDISNLSLKQLEQLKEEAKGQITVCEATKTR